MRWLPVLAVVILAGCGGSGPAAPGDAPGKETGTPLSIATSAELSTQAPSTPDPSTAKPGASEATPSPAGAGPVSPTPAEPEPASPQATALVTPSLPTATPTPVATPTPAATPTAVDTPAPTPTATAAPATGSAAFVALARMLFGACTGDAVDWGTVTARYLGGRIWTVSSGDGVFEVRLNEATDRWSVVRAPAACAR